MTLSHLNAAGEAQMVDVSGKQITKRRAEATGQVLTSAVDQILTNGLPKGDVCAVARIAGIMAAKRTPDLIPLCHPLAISAVEVSVVPNSDRGCVEITASVTTSDRTGVEMEALTAVSVAGLTVIDMIKAVDKAAVLTQVQVTYKSGGRSGEFIR